MTVAAWRSFLRAVLLALLAVGGANAADWVGARVCAGCHGEQARAWGSSDHARSMQQADSSTVLGNFVDAAFERQGVITRFLRRDGRYWIRTPGPTGGEIEYPVGYTFGHYPLQQYLLELPGGRLQAFSIAWDARPAAQGGQRWFDLYPDQAIAPGDPLHWTGRDQNWNHMCADCHSTNLRKNYDLTADRFATTWSEINVACEACHGPGGEHVAWARAGAEGKPRGLVVPLVDTRGEWRFEGSQRIASPRALQKGAFREPDACFACHSRRQPLGQTATPGRPFLDNYRPNLLERGLYHPDGQMDGEVFEFGSFVQSRMYRAGVNCSNCHDPHTLRLRKSGNALCGQCHQASHYDQPAHSRHAGGSEGSQCVSCHMPEQTYMGVDRRRDHGFRIPRPELTVRHGVPNACNQCHTGRDARWASNALEGWGMGGRDEPMADALAAAWQGRVQANELLARIAAQSSPIARATATSLLSAPLSQQQVRQIGESAADPDPLLRLGAAHALGAPPEPERVRLGVGLLSDPMRAVRVEAARALAGLPEAFFTDGQGHALQQAIVELIEAEQAAADRPESHLNLAQLYLGLNRPEAAERELQSALRLDRRSVVAWVNLADLYRGLQRDGDAETVLSQAGSALPQSPEVAYALALLRLRQQRLAEALPLLARAARLSPREPVYAYAHALALQRAGDPRGAVAVVRLARREMPENEVLRALERKLLRLAQ